MFLYLAPKKAGTKKQSQQARDREAAAEEKRKEDKGKGRETASLDEASAEMPANGGLLANAKISADALKKLTEDKED